MDLPCMPIVFIYKSEGFRVSIPLMWCLGYILQESLFNILLSSNTTKMIHYFHGVKLNKSDVKTITLNQLFFRD